MHCTVHLPRSPRLKSAFRRPNGMERWRVGWSRQAAFLWVQGSSNMDLKKLDIKYQTVLDEENDSFIETCDAWILHGSEVQIYINILYIYIYLYIWRGKCILCILPHFAIIKTSLANPDRNGLLAHCISASLLGHKFWKIPRCTFTLQSRAGHGFAHVLFSQHLMPAGFGNHAVRPFGWKR